MPISTINIRPFIKMWNPQHCPICVCGSFLESVLRWPEGTNASNTQEDWWRKRYFQVESQLRESFQTRGSSQGECRNSGPALLHGRLGMTALEHPCL